MAFAGIAAVAALLVGLGAAGGTSNAAGQTGEAEVKAYTDASLAATDVTMIGASPSEAPGETWGVGKEAGAAVVVRYATGAGWSEPGPLLSSSGASLSGFELAHPEGFKDPNPSPLAGQMTSNGSGALIGTILDPEAGSGAVTQVVLVREPGSSFKEVPAVPAALLKGREELFGLNRAPMLAALEEAGGHAGALVVPVDESGGSEEDVLHWNGSEWTSETIELPEPLKREKEEGGQVEFQVLAISASSPTDAWLLARYPGGLGLFRRHVGEGEEPTTWRGVSLKAGGSAGEALTVAVGAGSEPLELPSATQAQVLTATSQGVWVDGERADVAASTTMYVKAEGEDSARIITAWCRLPGGAPEGTAGCEHELPQALPSGPSRSYAWPNTSTPDELGERVISGLPDGVSLRLAGTQFKRTLALGGSPSPRDVGGTFGSAFSSATEGWLGQEELPVHLTLEAQASRLAPWPTAFRYALTAVAPAPDAPVGSLSSEALAVGDHGEVARYKPGLGWLPETLLGAGGKRETSARLRAVAWPTPERAYAVGDLGSTPKGGNRMWLWRGETGLWEPDPATPLNFRGNLLGIAFDPNDPSRGYAVGQDGVLLSYGKTWTQEPAEALPAAVVGASFTAIAFAGSEAIVSYRKLAPGGSNRYEGGLLVNDGSGWQIDQGAAAAMGSSTPWAVAGLPDGGAAFAVSGSGSSEVYEREAAGAPWGATPAHFPGNGPGSLVLFREGGALRAIASGSVPDTFAADDEQSAPPGFPPTLIPPYGLPSSSEKAVLRQTANGWSDEEHELNNTKEPAGAFTHYDTVYQPDPVAAVLVNESGSEGWAVGGFVEDRAALDTADVYRYPADGVTPTGVGSAPLSAASEDADFAIGGGAQCAAPCADLANARIGPDVWLSSALARAHEISGVRSFFYTGPRVTTGQESGTEQIAISFENELERYAALLGSGGLPAYPAASPTDLDEAHSEARFTAAFGGLPFAGDILEAGVPGTQADFYTVEEDNVRVIVIDNTHPVAEAQLAWLQSQLAAAKAAATPVLVVGNADLGAQSAAGDQAATNVIAALVEGGAAAYFFDAPEQNIRTELSASGKSIPAFGSGTLGYVNFARQEEPDFIGASGFLLAEVNRRTGSVAVKLIPNIGELAMEAQDGTLLRRSEPALFSALARRPRSGNRAHNGSTDEDETSPYIPIPSECVGSAVCSEGIFPEYEFSSSNEKVGQFVERNTHSAETHAVELGANGKPIDDAHSGLFCAFNPGTTTVTIKAGGLSYSLPVTVESGSARRPCGTVPAASLPSSTAPVPAPPPTQPAPAPTPTPAVTPVLPPPPLAAVVPPPAPKPVAHTPAPPTFLPVLQPVPGFLPAFVPPPLPTPARPTPPSGTSAVEAVQREEEEEAAPESVSNEAVAYRQTEHEPAPEYLLGLILLAAFAGASLRKRGRGRREVKIAPATISAMRAERRMSSRMDRWR